MPELHKSFLFASGFQGRGTSLDFGIKYAQGLSSEEQEEIESLLRRICERRAFESLEGGWRLALHQRATAAGLHLRGVSGVDHRGRPTWIAFGLCTGSPTAGADWETLAICEPSTAERLPVPELAPADPECAAFWQAARDGGRPWNAAPAAAARRGRRAWLMVAGLGLLAALGAAYAGGWIGGQGTPPAPPAPPPVPDPVAAYILEERVGLRSALAFLRARGAWRFAAPPAPAGALDLDTALAALAALVESDAGRDELERRLARWRLAPGAWPLDARGAPIEPRLVLLGTHTLSDEELGRIGTWCRLLLVYRLARGAPGASKPAAGDSP